MKANQLDNNIPCWDDITRDKYFKWLCELVGVYQGESNGYWYLMQILQNKEFVWFVPNDDNRVEDGLALRYDFMECYYDIYELGQSLTDPCSVLEMLVALAIRMDDSIVKPGEDTKVSDRFFEIIDNLGLTPFSDDRYEGLGDPNNPNYMYALENISDDIVVMNDILDTFIERRYNKDGNGGLFPLINPKYDQRTTEIWYQMSEYLMENYY